MLNKAEKLKLPEPKNQDDIGKIDHPKYCLYHRGLGHPTKSCWALRDKLQTLVDAGILKLKPEWETATANMSSCMQFGQSPPDSTTIIPISAAEMRIISLDPHRQQEDGFVPDPIPDGGNM